VRRRAYVEPTETGKRFISKQTFHQLERKEVEMNLLLVACIFAVVPVASLGLVEVQSRLERREQRRHAED
jgi:hypothetical protein